MAEQHMDREDIFDLGLLVQGNSLGSLDIGQVLT